MEYNVCGCLFESVRESTTCQFVVTTVVDNCSEYQTGWDIHVGYDLNVSVNNKHTFTLNLGE